MSTKTDSWSVENKKFNFPDQEIQRMWPDSTVFIIGGGRSLNKTNLEWDDINGDVILQSISNDLSCIHNEKVIGVNNSYELGDWVDMCFYGDTRWFDWNKEGLKKFNNLIVCCHPHNKIEWVKTINRENGFGINTEPDRVSWNKSSGASAINLAYHLGAKNVVLIGFDMFAKADGEDNFHKKHEITNELSKTPYERMLSAFPEIKIDADKLGMRIINANLISKIECFEKMELSEAIENLK